MSLDAGIGLEAKPGTVLQVVSHFPEQARLLRPDGARFKAGDTLDLWLRPFEVLMLEVTPAAKDAAALPLRSVSRRQAAALGEPLALNPATLDARMDLRFADANSFAAQGLKKKVYAFETTLPSLAGNQSILAVAVRLRKGDAEWRHAPTVAQIVQVLARIGGQNVQLIPVPDGRQFGNTQSTAAPGCFTKSASARSGRASRSRSPSTPACPTASKPKPKPGKCNAGGRTSRAPRAMDITMTLPRENSLLDNPSALI